MKTVKMSRNEMRNFMAGSGGGMPCRGAWKSDCGGGGEYSCQKCTGLAGYKTCSNA